MAAGSAFTNGLPRLLPRSVHVPLIWLFMPQFIAIGVLFFWLIRIHFTRWYDGNRQQPNDLVIGMPLDLQRKIADGAATQQPG